jgi:hypothetical protein
VSIEEFIEILSIYMLVEVVCRISSLEWNPLILDNMQNDTKIKDIYMGRQVGICLDEVNLRCHILICSSEYFDWLIIQRSVSEVNELELKVIVNNDIVWLEV